MNSLLNRPNEEILPSVEVKNQQKSNEGSLDKKEKVELKIYKKELAHDPLVRHDEYEVKLKTTATKGVIQLFNAVLHAKKDKEQKNEKLMTKKNFTNLLEKVNKQKAIQQEKKVSTSWGVLKDDFATNPEPEKKIEVEMEVERGAQPVEQVSARNFVTGSFLKGTALEDQIQTQTQPKRFPRKK
uniref:RRP15-like protein n=1 Tax=Arcella intermedia TaxID=1963864 RepID=A0A6B2LIL5_9EUKA